MKKILIALMLVVAMLAITACGAPAADTSEPDAASPTDAVSSADASGSDVTSSDAVPAPEGFEGCIIGDIYFCYPETYKKADVSGSDTVSVSADSNSGASVSVMKSVAVDMDVALLSKTDLDAIGEKGADDLERVFGEGVKAEYTYVGSGDFLEGKGVYFDFDITVTYETVGVSQTFSYRQIYIGKGADLYIFTFASNTSLGDSIASEYFADVIGSIAFNGEE